MTRENNNGEVLPGGAAVEAAVEAVWQCETADDALRALDVLQATVVEAASKDRSLFSPETVFLAIQGVTLRFAAPTKDEKQEEPPLPLLGSNPNSATNAVVVARSLQAAAALAKARVGPAWGCQFLEEEEERRPRAFVGDEKSCDLRGERPQALLDATTTTAASAVLHVPEVLPANMIRFAAASCNRATTDDDDTHDARRTIAELQMELVSAFSCSPLKEEGAGEDSDRRAEEEEGKHSSAKKRRRRWNIPGVEEAIDTMLLSWFEIGPATSRYGYCSHHPDQSVEACCLWNRRVLRVCTDLLQAGYSPVRETCKGLVDALLNLAVAGTGGSSSSCGRCCKDSSSTMCPTAAQAVSTLALLGSYDLIPVQSLDTVVRGLCSLDFAIRRQMAADDASYESCLCCSRAQLSIAEAWKDCPTDIWNLLLTLLTLHSTSEHVFRHLWSVVNAANPASPECQRSLPCGDETGDMNPTGLCTQAGLAIRVIGTALWGKPAEWCLPVSSLRIHWNATIASTGQILSSICAEVSAQPGPRFSSIGALCLFATETIGALTMLVERESSGDDRCSSREWDAIIECIELGVLPWLSFDLEDACDGSSAICKVVSAAEDFVAVLAECFEKMIQKRSASFVEYSSQKKLYVMLLREAAPVLKEEISRALGSSVFRSWALFGLFPHRLEGWKETTSELLAEAFRRSSDGFYIHSPHVRLTALKSLSYDGCEFSADHEGTAYENSTAEAGNSVSAAPPLIAVTQPIREKHEIIESSVVPALKEILFAVSAHGECCREPSPRLHQDRPLPSCRGTADDAAYFLGNAVDSVARCDLSDLELFAVNLAGRLYRNISCSRRHRALLLSLIRSVALNTAMVAGQPEKLSHTWSVRIAAVRGLGHCLASSFSFLSQAHEFLPSVIDTLCLVLDEYTTKLRQKCRQSIEFSRMTVLAIFALDPMTRLQATGDGKVVFYCGDDTIESLQGALKSFFLRAFNQTSKNQYPSAILSGGPFLTSRDAADKTLPPDVTRVPFEAIFQSAIALLKRSPEARNSTTRILGWCVGKMRTHCFYMLNSLASANIALSLPETVTSEVFLGDYENLRGAERAARNAALAGLVQSFFVMECKRARRVGLPSVSKDRSTANSSFLLSLVVGLCDSGAEEERIFGLKLMLLLLPAVRYLEQFSPNAGGFENMCSSIREQVISVCNMISKSRPSQVSQELVTGFSALLEILTDLIVSDMPYELPVALRLHAYQLCSEVVSILNSRGGGYPFHLALRCLRASVYLMDENEVKQAAVLTNDTTDEKEQGSQDLRRIVSEVLLSRQHVLESGNTDCQTTVAGKAPSKLDELALETENLERFEVNKENSARTPVSATWLYGDSGIITCRVGADKSRFQGWTEVVLRSATSRRRVLVRTDKSDGSLIAPDLPCALWAAHGSSSTPTARKPADSVTQKQSPSNATRRAQAVLDRFDNLIGAVADTGSDFSLDSSTDAERLTEELFSHRSIDSAQVNEDYPSQAMSNWLSSAFDSEATGIVQETIDSLLESCGILKRPPGLDTDELREKRLVPGPRLDRAISVLDRTTELDTHKVAVLYDAPAQQNLTECTAETQLLTGSRCSPGFCRFIEALGEIVPTQHLKYFTGGLDISLYESDGQHALAWMDADEKDSSALATTVVVFHVAALMPEGPTNRRKHIGNDNVFIIFSDDADGLSEDRWMHHMSVIGGSFGFVTIYVTEPRPDRVRVSMRVKSGLSRELAASLQSLACDNVILPAESAASFVRSLAMRADIACRAAIDSLAPPSNCLERCRLIRDMKRYVIS